MTALQQLRWWFRRAGAAEMVAVAVPLVLVLALLVWAVVPNLGSDTATAVAAGAPRGGSSKPLSAGAAVAGSAAGSTDTTTTVAASGTGGGGGSGSAGSTSGGAAPAASGQAAASGSAGGSSSPAGGGGTSGCGELKATDQGVTPTEIHLAIALVNLAGAAGNGLFGVPPVAQQQGDFQAVIDDINKNGGIQCRKVVPTYYQGNPLDQNQEHATCLQIVQDKPFALLDVSALDSPPAARDCVPQAKIPLFDVVPILQSEAQKDFFPYEFTYFGQWDTILRDTVLGAHQLGWFNGAQKVGLLEESCAPEMNTEVEAALAEIGVTGGQVVKFDYGCPGALIPPNETAQAVLQMKTSGADHIIDVGIMGANDFSKQAQQQGYKPKYLIPDGGAVATFQSPQFAPDPNNFDGALAITDTQYAGDHSPGVPLSEATKQCDAIMAAGGQPPLEQQGVAFGGVACNLTHMFQVAAAHDQGLTRVNMVNGLDQSGSLDMSFPQGPAKFDARPRLVSGGEFWRPVVYDGSCPCFRVADATFRPNFT